MYCLLLVSLEHILQSCGEISYQTVKPAHTLCRILFRMIHVLILFGSKKQYSWQLTTLHVRILLSSLWPKRSLRLTISFIFYIYLKNFYPQCKSHNTPSCGQAIKLRFGSTFKWFYGLLKWSRHSPIPIFFVKACLIWEPMNDSSFSNDCSKCIILKRGFDSVK